MCSDLRPISILPLPGRVFEKIINTGMSAHLERSNYLADQQNGFRPGRSTTKTLATLIDEVLLAMDEGEFAVTVLLDYSKAFDAIYHAIL